MAKLIFLVLFCSFAMINCVEAEEKKAISKSSPSFCISKYGKDAGTVLDPYEANGSGVVDTVFNGAKPIITKDTPKPKAFKCTISPPLAGGTISCPKGMVEKKHQLGGNSCFSEKFPICKLCPEELGVLRPDLKGSFCKKHCENVK